MKKLLRTCADVVTRRLRRFAGDTRGNFGIMLGLSAVPLIGLSGLALDYGGALTAKSRLDSAADAAALAAVIEATNVMQTQAAAGTSNWSAAAQAGQNRGMAVFRPTAGSKIDTSTWSVTMTNSSGAVTATVSYSTSVPTSFGKILSVDEIPLSGTRVASRLSQANNQYLQVIFLLDNSGSMAIGGTDADTTALSKVTGCRFACHDSQVKFDTGCDSCLQNTDYYTYIRSKYPGIQLKFDYAKAAVQDFMSSASTLNASKSGQIEVGVQTFATFWNEVRSPTSSASAVQSALNGAVIEDATAVYYADTNKKIYGGHQGFTYTSTALKTTLGKLANIGDGSSPSARKTYVVLVSDGVEDVYDTSAPGDRQTGQMFDPKVCQQLKDAGVTLITIATPYPVLENSPHFDEWVAPIYDAIVPKMRDCASDPTKLFFQANDGPAIQAAATKIFAVIQTMMMGNAVLVK